MQVWDVDLQAQAKVPKVYFNPAVAPVVTNDVAHGYHIGDIWITTGNAAYLLTTDTAGAANWKTL